MVGLRRPKNIPCVGGGRRLAQGAPNEFGLQGPSANGRPAPTEESLFASAKADARRASALEADFNRRRAFGRRSACADRRIPLCVGEGRRPARKRLRGRFQSARGPSKAPDVAAGGIPLHTGGQTMRRPSPGERAVGAPAFPQEGVPAGNDPHRRGRLQDVGRPLRREKVPFVGSGHRDGGGPPHGCST